MRSSLLVAPLLIAVLLSTPLPIFAQDESEEPVGWSGAAEGTFVFTGGNSDATSVGFRLELGRDLLGGSLALEGGGIRVSTGIRTRTAVGTVDLFALREETVTSLTAENYHARVRFERALDDALLWYVGVAGIRNHFAGIDSRYAAVVGLSRRWLEGVDGSYFRTDLGVTYTRESYVALLEGTNFAGLRLSWDYIQKLGDSTTFDSTLAVDDNLNDTADLRFDLLNSIAVAMSERLALKVSYQLRWDNRPALVSVPLIGVDGTASGDTVLAILRKTDSLLTLALALDF